MQKSPEPVGFKNNFWGYFQFSYQVVGNRFFLNLLLCALISFWDGIGLVMFIPLLQSFGTSGGVSGNEYMGQLHYVVDFFHYCNIPLSVNVILITLVGLFILKGLLRFLQLSYQAGLKHFFTTKIRLQLVNYLQGLSYKGFLKIHAGAIQNTFIGEINRLSYNINIYFSAAQAMVMLLTYIVLAFLANYQFAVLVAAGAALSHFLYRRIYNAVKKASVEVSESGDDFNGFLLQAVHQFKYLKASGYFSKYSVKLKRVLERTEWLNRKMDKYAAITTSIREPLIIIIVVLVLYVQVNWMEGNVASVFLSLLLFYRALNYLVSVQTYWQQFIQNVGAVQAVSGMMEKMAAGQELRHGRLFPGLNRMIQLENVGFSYGKHRVLEGINLTIQKNKTIALVGESGSGKTSMANVISGLIQPSEGEVLCDGIPLSQYDLESYRDTIGYIPQEPAVFNDTIFNNVTFWAEPTEENRRRFREVISMASLDEMVQSQSEREQTRLGDNGILISGGQKQRIAIARELYKNGTILILDEATSSMDSETEYKVQENIGKLHGHYTLIIIAHRLSTVKHADLVCLLEQGTVTATGTFGELMISSERFKRMVALQVLKDG